jgi:PRTRC genetic system protein C
MALEVINLKRVFKFGKETLSDPDPNFSLDEVQGWYSVKYPELTTATMTGPKTDGDTAVYELTTKIGTKG